MFINIKESKNIVIGECFTNLQDIVCDTVFHEKNEDVRKDIYINVLVKTKSLSGVTFIFNMCQADDFYTRLFFDVDLYNNDNIQNVNVDNYGVERGFAKLHNFSFSNSGGVFYIGSGGSLDNVNLKNYRILLLEDDCKINSGYYDLNSSAEENLFNSTHCGRGGFYTQAFKAYADANQPNFVDEGFYWEQTGDERYPWTISGVTMIDGVPIYDKTKIDKVVLTTDGPTRLIWDFNYYTFYVNYSRSINLDFDSSYTNLKTLELSDVFTNYDYGPGKNVYVDVSIDTPSLKIVDFYYSSFFGFGFDDYMVYFNIDLNNVPLRKFVCTRRETGLMTCVYQMTFNNINKSIMGDAGDLYIHDVDLIFNNCSFLVYNSGAHFYLSFINSLPRINSGYFDYDSSKPFADTNLLLCGYGGLYTESMYTYLTSEEPNYVAIGYKWYGTGLKDYPWAIVPSERTLSPTPEEIQRDLDDMTTMEGELDRSFAFRIAYSYNYPGEENKFQIQMSFDYEGILNYCLNVEKGWGKDGFGPSDSLCINFYTSNPNNYVSYDLIQDKVFYHSYMAVSVLDKNPQLPDAPLMRGFKVFTLDLGDLLGDDSENKTKEIEYSELEALFQTDGGHDLIVGYLLVDDKEWVDKHWDAPIEYFWYPEGMRVYNSFCY